MYIIKWGIETPRYLVAVENRLESTWTVDPNNANHYDSCEAAQNVINTSFPDLRNIEAVQHKTGKD